MKMILQPAPSLCIWASEIGVQFEKSVARPSGAFFARFSHAKKMGVQ